MVERGREAEERVGGKRELTAVSPSTYYDSPLPIREAPPNFHLYPPALAKYQDVVANPTLFMDTLQKLHAAMGTKFMIPTIGGKELNLHRLFVEVTSRGGIEQIIKERRWKDVTAVFNFPSTATNASFVLRKYYVSLLHHYEQIYFFRAKGWTSPVASVHISSPSQVSAQGSFEPVVASSEAQAAETHKRRRTTPSSAVGCPVVGVIDGKFEHGYLVTVTVGTEKLRGVLYHTTDPQDGQMPRYANFFDNCIGKDTAAPRRRRRRKKSEMRKRDPAHPKPNRSGYNFFFAEQHARLKPLHPGKDREISKMIGDLWSKLTETEKAVYQERGVKDKERYRSEMEEYRERLRTGQIIGNAVPIQQRGSVPEVTMEEGDLKTGEEVDSPHIVEGDSNSGETGSEDGNSADKEMEIEASSGAVNGTESSNAAPGILAEEDCFELQGDERDGDVDQVHKDGNENQMQNDQKDGHENQTQKDGNENLVQKDAYGNQIQNKGNDGDENQVQDGNENQTQNDHKDGDETQVQDGNENEVQSDHKDGDENRVQDGKNQVQSDHKDEDESQVQDGKNQVQNDYKDGDESQVQKDGNENQVQNDQKDGDDNQVEKDGNADQLQEMDQKDRDENQVDEDANENQMQGNVQKELKDGEENQVQDSSLGMSVSVQEEMVITEEHQY